MIGAIQWYQFYAGTPSSLGAWCAPKIPPPSKKNLCFFSFSLRFRTPGTFLKKKKIVVKKNLHFFLISNKVCYLFKKNIFYVKHYVAKKPIGVKGSKIGLTVCPMIGAIQW